MANWRNHLAELTLLSADHSTSLPHTPPWPERKHMTVLDYSHLFIQEGNYSPASKNQGFRIKQFQDKHEWKNNASEGSCVSPFCKHLRP